MKQHITTLLQKAIIKLQEDGTLPSNMQPNIQLTHAKDPQHGDFATNLALMLAKATHLPPKQLAAKIMAYLPQSEYVTRVDMAGPGFINFFLTENSFHSVIPDILQIGENYGKATIGTGQRVHVEYVSANPTGPLHVGHGRSAAYGACVANLLEAIGYNVHQEYYVNDAGRQIRILTLSVWLRYVEAHNETLVFPSNAYQEQYIIDIAHQLRNTYGDRFYYSQKKIAALLPQDRDLIADKEIFMDTYIEVAKKLLGDENFDIIFQAALDNILTDIKEDLREFHVTYHQWFRESDLIKEGLITAGIQRLAEKGYVYEKEGAQWFRATALGDEKDRVLIRKNGQSTYFASDVAYHLHKYQQGYDQMIDIFGADHHGYIARIQCYLKGLGEDPTLLTILLVQFAILYRGKERISMSTRGGQFVTLRELREEVGNDAARFFYIMRKPEQHLDFDLALAKSKSNENPVYYIQYAHARICSVWRQLDATQLSWNKDEGLAHLSQLSSPYEKDLLSHLTRYPEVVKNAALQYAPHLIAHYLQELANHFHTYYNAEKFLVKEETLRNARLCLIAATQQVVANGLTLLDVSTPQEM